jgi:type IV pilus assembly protein PilW
MNAPRSQSGLSLVELLVGAAITLVVVAGALKLFASHIDSNRRLLLEARLHQDLRAASDLIARDLRRAGYWQSALKATTWPPLANPYRAFAPSGAASAAIATYSYSRDSVENDSVDGNELFGVRLSAGALQMQDGSGGWQQLTDVATVLVTGLSVAPVIRSLSLGHLCTPACTSADPACPALNIRRFDIVLRGRSTADASVVREVRESVRLRNDDVFPAGCP